MRIRSNAPRALLAAISVGLVLSAAVVWQSTAAAFTATTDNTGNSWATGSVVLTDSDNGSKLFDTTRDGLLTPALVRSKCIRVDYTGSLPANIKLYVSTPSSSPTGLDQYLVMSVERGADVAATTTMAPDCSTGFTPRTPLGFMYNSGTASSSVDQSLTMAALKLNAGDYAHGLDAGDAIASNTSLTYKITFYVMDLDAAQSKQSVADFTWEARNT